MHFAILDVEEKTDDHGSYTSFVISINGGHHSSLRYSQLRELHDQLKKEFGPDRPHAPFPPKKLLNLNQTQLEERRDMLEKYLQAVSQDSEMVTSRTFVKFLLKAQKEEHKVEEEDVKLDLYLMNGKKFQVDVRNTDSTDHVVQEAMAQIKLPADLVQYFALFLVQRGDDGEISVVRKLQGFESPYLVLAPFKDDHRLVVRKNFWNSKIEDELYKDKIALNLLFVQAVSDVERDWVLTTPEVLKELNNLKTQNARKKYLKLARTQKFYSYIQFKPCLMDFPEADSHVMVNIGNYELNFRLIGTQKQTGKEGSFKVTRVKCWRVMSSRDKKNGEVVTKVAFQYLFTKEKLEWVTITSDQAMLMSLCLQGMVDEIIKEKKKQNTSGSEKTKAAPAAAPSPKAEPTKEQPAKPSAAADKEPVKSQRRDSMSSSGSNEGSRAEKNGSKESEESPTSEKRKTKKEKKSKKIASVKNEVFAQDIGDEDL